MGERRPLADPDGRVAVTKSERASARAGAAAAPVPRPPNRVHVVWKGGQRFDSGRPDGPVARIDGNAETGPSPVDAVLGGLAACTSIDVVEILVKRRTPVTALEIEVAGTRVESTPRRLTHVELAFRITGAGIERAHAERAVELAITKYCSVRDSLRQDIQIDWTVELSG